MGTAEIKSYLGHLYVMEKTLYQQNEFYEELQRQLNSGARQQKLQSKEKTGFLWILDIVGSSLIFGVGAMIALLIVVGILSFFISGIEDFMDAQFPTARIAIPKMLAVALVFAVIRAIVYVNETIVRNKKTDAANAVTRQQNAAALSDKAALNQRIREQMKTLQSTIQKNTALLNKYYAKNILLPKYRGLTEVGTLYQYFNDGLCFELEGPGGAYVLFREDIKHNQIMDKLDQITANQYMLMNDIRGLNQQTARLSQQVIQTAGQIQQNTEVIAYNTEVTRKLTEFQLWVNALEG